MVNFPTWAIWAITALLLVYIFLLVLVFFSTIILTPLRNYDHVVVSLFIDFLSNSKGDGLFHSIAYECFCAYWDSLHDHLRDVPRENIFKFGASTTAIEFCECVQVGIYIYIYIYIYI